MESLEIERPRLSNYNSPTSVLAEDSFQANGVMLDGAETSALLQKEGHAAAGTWPTHLLCCYVFGRYRAARAL